MSCKCGGRCQKPQELLTYYGDPYGYALTSKCQQPLSPLPRVYGTPYDHSYTLRGVGQAGVISANRDYTVEVKPIMGTIDLGGVKVRQPYLVFADKRFPRFDGVPVGLYEGLPGSDGLPQMKPTNIDPGGYLMSGEGYGPDRSVDNRYLTHQGRYLTMLQRANADGTRWGYVTQAPALLPLAERNAITRRTATARQAQAGEVGPVTAAPPGLPGIPGTQPATFAPPQQAQTSGGGLRKLLIWGTFGALGLSALDNSIQTQKRKRRTRR